MTTLPHEETTRRLYGLLPQVVRLRDIEAWVESTGKPYTDDSVTALTELLGILAGQLDVVGGELDQFYADQFIETCADWVVPYIGDLIGYRMVHGRAPGAPSPRAEVAHTISYRRRKGTAAMLEQLARDVTGWPARAVEFFERLATTQYLNHLRPHAVATADMRHREALGQVTSLAGAFDDLAHTADVRRIDAAASHGRGRHNIPNLGIFLFRTMPMPLVRSRLARHQGGDDQRFRFDPLGADTPLFSKNDPEDEITHLATPLNVPLPLTVRWFDDHVAEYYAQERGLLVEIESGGVVTAVPLADVRPSDLRDVAGGWANMPPAGKVAIDPERGRVAFGTPLAAGDVPLGTFYLGMAVPVGARTIERGGLDQRLEAMELPALPTTPVVAAQAGGDLQPHLDAVAAGGVLRLRDSARWVPGGPGTPRLHVDPVAAGQPAHVAAVVSETSARPLVHAPQGWRLELAPGSTAILDGLMVHGGPVFLDEVGDAQPRTVVLTDCTLVPGLTRTTDGAPGTPGAAGLVVLDPFATVVLDGCVTGPIVLVEGARLVVHGSVVDAGDPAAVAICGREDTGVLRTVASAADWLAGDGTAESGDVLVTASTVVGGIHATRLDTTDAVLLADLPTGDPRLAAVWAQRRQVGCLRFSWLPADSRTGRRFRCQPDREDSVELQERTLPTFTSLRFGDPAYVQLADATPLTIRRGAEDESEMGATHDLYAPQREDDVTQRLEEYLRFGLSAGVFHAT